jgi:hypothetical protein
VPVVITDLGAAVDAFCATPLDDLDQVGLQAHAVTARKLAQRLLGASDRALGLLNDRYQGSVVTNPDSDGAPLYQPTQGWWRDATVRTGQQAGTDVRRAAALRDLPLLAEAVVDGVLSQEQVAVLCRLRGKLHLEDLQASQEQLVTVATGMNTDALGRWVAHLIATHCEPAFDEEQERARERRYLQLRREADGTVRGTFVLANEDAEVVLTVLEPLARQQGKEDKRSAGQRRADALVEVFAGAAAWMELPVAGGQRAQVSYVMTADWCAAERPEPLARRLAELGTAGTAGLHPLALERYAPDGAWTGPQTRARLEAVLCDARISRMLVDPHGTVLSLESLTDAITSAQRKAVSVRDRHCVAKGCTRPPAFCDVHHLVHLEHGGTTSLGNLVLLCRRHHVLWHRGTIGLHDLHVPWFSSPAPLEEFSPCDGHSPHLIA